MLNLQQPGPAILLSSVLLFMPVLGCAKKAFVVEVPRGFSGYVHIFCGSNLGLPTEPVHVNSLGGADTKWCPGGDADVTVLRDGKTATAVAVSWERAGDGTPVALSFNVK